MVGLDVTHRALLTDAHAARRAPAAGGVLVACLHAFYSCARTRPSMTRMHLLRPAADLYGAELR